VIRDRAGCESCSPYPRDNFLFADNLGVGLSWRYKLAVRIFSLSPTGRQFFAMQDLQGPGVFMPPGRSLEFPCEPKYGGKHLLTQSVHSEQETRR
jgi:hypothetical protein